MHNTRVRISYDIVKDWDLEQIAQDHSDIMISDFNNGLLDSYLSDIEESIIMTYYEKNYKL